MTFGQPSVNSPARQSQGEHDWRLQSPAQLALIGLGVWLVGAVLHPLAVLAPLGLLLLLVAGAAYLVRPRIQRMYWRGRAIDLDDDRGTAQELYRRVFKR